MEDAFLPSIVDIDGKRHEMIFAEHQMKSSTDEFLLAACCEGESDAWDEFVSRFGRLVYSVAMKRGCNTVDADEVFQQTFAIAWQHLSELRDVKGVRSWLVTTALRECWRIQKKEAKHQSQELLPRRSNCCR